MSKITKTAVVSVVGRPNVGKSTLTNKLVGQKVAIVSSKPQTTRTRITGVLSRGETQYVLLDTPGLHKPRSRLGDYMCKVVTDTVSEVDVAVLVVEPIPNIGPAEESLIAQIKQHHMPAILVINKIDTVKKEELLAVIATYAAVHEFDAVVPISARTGEGVEELLTEIDKYAIEGPQLFPEDMVSDQPERQLVAEIIREKMLRLLDREVPHGVAVGIERWNEREDGLVEINAVIYCEKASHKGIIIGKGGAMLKKIFDPTLFRFLLVGVVNTLVGYGVMFGLYNLAGLHLWGDPGYWISSAANYVVGSVVSFFLNKHFTFRNQERGAGVVLRFAVNIAVCWALAYGLAKPATVWLLSGTGWSPQLQGNLSMLAGSGLFVLLNYFGQRFFAFRSR